MLIDGDAPGDRDKACQLLTEAIGMYRQIGMPKHMEIAEVMLAGPSHRPRSLLGWTAARAPDWKSASPTGD